MRPSAGRVRQPVRAGRFRIVPLPSSSSEVPVSAQAELLPLPSARQRAIMVGLTVLPFAGTIAGVLLLWNRAVGWVDLALFAAFYLAAGFGVTVGYHRMLTHRAFEAPAPVRATLLALGSMALQGPPIPWAVDHRTHHAFSDKEGDPHSPHHGFPDTLWGELRGLVHAHTGWLFETHGQADWRKYARELYEDPGMRRINRMFPWLALASIAIPTALGWLIHGGVDGAARGLVWGGLVRAFLLHHVTWSINSVCHFFGRRRFDLEDHSTNVAWLALPSLGEAWHHNHHAFPRSAAHGLGRWEIDLSALLIRAMKRVGLAWNVVEIAPERQAARAIGRKPAAAPPAEAPEREPAGVS